ncbi:hypothetical protein FBU59_002430, partial [Linderina macrospora]
MTVLELSSSAKESLARDSLLFKGFRMLFQNPYSKETNPEGIINAGIAANNTISDLVLEKLNSLTGVVATDLEYNAPYGEPKLRYEIADLFNRYLSPAEPVNPDAVTVFNGCTSAISKVTAAICDPGDHVLVPAPCYAALDSDMATLPRAVATPVDIPIEEAFAPSQVKYFEEKITELKQQGKRTKILFLMTPHNPLGASYPKETLRALFEFASKHSLFVVSDEIYALSVFDAKEGVTPFESVLSWNDLSSYIDPASLIVMHGLSKDFGLNGFRMGWTITPWNQDLTNVLHNYAPFGYRPAYTDRLITEFLADHAFIDDLLATSKKNLAENYSMAADFFVKHNIEYVPCSAGHFVWFRMPIAASTKAYRALGTLQATEVAKSWTKEGDLAAFEHITLNERVYFPTGQAFSSTEPG